MVIKRKGSIKVFKFWLSLFLLPLFLLIISTPLEAAYLKNVPVKVVQPNGEEIQVFASGDEFYNWLHDKAGFTIIKNPRTGYYVYALEKQGDLLPSNYAITSDYVINTASISYLNIPPYLKHSWEKRKKPKELFPEGSAANVDKIRKAPQTGVINNIVIFVRFSDESEFEDSISTYDALFNDTAAGANSMYNYYEEVSYNQLEITTTFYPTTTTTVVSFQDLQPRAYYQQYDETTNTIGYQDDDERKEREHALLKNAVDYVSPQIPGSLDVDADDDNYVDNVCFIIYGDPDGWNDLLWPHMWSLYTTEAYINDKRVLTYNFQLQNSLSSSGVGVLCHEMFHSLGAPDLYHYSYDGLQPVYEWDIMECNLNPPQHMGAYMKYRYGTWISSIPEITSDGTYDLNPLTSPTNNCYKIASLYSSAEYFMVEYRKKSGIFESSLPGEGLLVYRINTNKEGEGNSEGPPDEVYIYRPDGTTTLNGDPSNANFSIDVDRPAINDTTNPSSFLSDGCQGGLDISNVGSVNGVISFDVTIVSGLELAEALDNDDLSWQSGGDGAGWLGQRCVYFYDNDAAKSHDISGGQSNYLETTVQGPVNLAFYWKVSSEEGYDFLTFYVDDEQIYQISGEVDWEQKIYSLGEGSHSIKWEYKKDMFVSDGSDCGWVDKVEYITDVSFTISGFVTASGSEGVKGVMIAFSNDGGTVTTVSDGSYSHSVSLGWSGTATPSKPGYIFSPASRDYTNVASNQTDQDYTATSTDITYTVSGKVSVGGASSQVRMSAQEGLSGVAMNGLPGSPTTDDSGNYSASVEYGWSGTVIPSKAGYSFSPSSRNYSNVTSDQQDQHYTATAVQPEYSWNSRGPYGGYIQSLAMSQIDPNIMYSRTYRSVYKTINGGATWTKTSFPDIEFNTRYDPGSPEIVISPDNNDVIYTGSYRDGIYKSEDGGKTWTQIGLYGQKVNTIAIDPNNSNILYLGTGDWYADYEGEIRGIFKSEDGGATWETLISWEGWSVCGWDQVYSILVDPNDSSNIYAGGNNSGYCPSFGGFLKSTDSGETWTNVALDGTSRDEITALAMPPSWYSTQVIYALGTGDAWGVELYKSTDRGNNWVKINNPYTFLPQASKVLAVDPISPQWIYVGTEDDARPLFAYNNDEDQWYYFDEPGLPSQAPSCLKAHPQENFVLFLGFSEDGLYKLTGIGGYWIPSSTGINNACINALAVSPVSSDTVFAAIDEFANSLLKTTDSGVTWENFAYAPSDISAISISRHNPSKMLVGKDWQGGGVAESYNFYISKSTDGGESWTDKKFATCIGGDCYTRIADILLGVDDPDCILVAATPVFTPSSGLQGVGMHARTTNGGITWDQVLYECSSAALAADPNNPDIVYSGKIRTGQVFRLENVWGNWSAEEITPAEGIGDVQDIEVDTNSYVYVATNSGLMKWNGSNWIKLSDFSTENIISLAIDRVASPPDLYAGTDGYGVFVSNDGGNTWTEFNDGLGNLNITKLAISDTQPKVIYAGTAYAGVWSRKIHQYTLTIAADAGGTTDPAPGTYYYSRDEEVSVKAMADPGHGFEKWAGNVPSGHENDNPIILTMDSNKSITADFYVLIPQVIISGSVKTSGGQGLEGVTITLSNEGGSTTTDSSGNYSRSVNEGWSGTATPSKTGYAFSPQSRSYENITSDQAGQDYTANILTYTISGNVSTGEALAKTNVARGPKGEREGELLRGSQIDKMSVSSSSRRMATQGGLSGVVMNGLPGNPITDDSGSYSAIVDYGWSGTVTPTKAGHTFVPTSRTYTDIISDQTGEDYAATIITYTISGKVSTGEGLSSRMAQSAGGLSGVVMGGLPGNPITDDSGSYSATVDYGFSGTVTPTKAGYSFSPTSKAYANVVSDQLNQHYTASIIQHTLTIVCGAGGMTTPSPGSYVYDYGTEVSITATSEAGCRCGGWTGDVPPGCENDNPLTITMDADKTIEANFIRQYTLNIAVSGTGGTTDPAPGSYTHDSGIQVSVTARPDSGYQLSGWSGDASGTATVITITMDSDKYITASFSPIPPGDTGDGDGGGKKGCFIATAAYGSALHPHLDILRGFRDKYLMRSGYGRKLVALYYRYSPNIANFIAKHKLLKAAVRINLLPVIAFSSLIVHFGPLTAAIMLLFMLVFSILFIRFYQEKGVFSKNA